MIKINLLVSKLLNKPFFKGDDMKNIILWTALLGTTAMLAACSPQAAEKHNNQSSGTVPGTGTVLVGSVHLSLWSGSTLLFDDRNPTTVFTLVAGQTYTLRIDSSEAAGAGLSLELTNISEVMASPVTIPIVSGDNSFSVSSQGTYAARITVTAAGMSPRVQQYQLEASCASPTFTQASLDGNAISVSGSQNLYSYNAAGVIASADGQAPYQYAWDPTGVQIRHTPFSAQTTLTNFYSDLVGLRNVGLIVKDACNTAHVVSAFRTLAWSPPAFPGNNFIEGHTASGSESPDDRYENVDYLATNPGPAPVDAMYGGGTFVVESELQYDMPGSVAHGVKIEIRGLVESVPIDPATMTGQITIPPGTPIYKLTYTTDKDGDARPPVSLTGMNCTWGPTAQCQVLQTAGVPCADNSGTNNETTVECWGDYTCNGMTGGADGLVDIVGRFDGSWTIADGCVGGQGQGQGGIFPINF
jgi:hypothetical protein